MLRSDTELSHPAPLYPLHAIVGGGFDSDLAAWGQAVAAFSTPIAALAPEKPVIVAEFGTDIRNPRGHGLMPLCAAISPIGGFKGAHMVPRFARLSRRV